MMLYKVFKDVPIQIIVNSMSYSNTSEYNYYVNFGINVNANAFQWPPMGRGGAGLWLDAKK